MARTPVGACAPQRLVGSPLVTGGQCPAALAAWRGRQRGGTWRTFSGKSSAMMGLTPQGLHAQMRVVGAWSANGRAHIMLIVLNDLVVTVITLLALEHRLLLGP